MQKKILPKIEFLTKKKKLIKKFLTKKISPKKKNLPKKMFAKKNLPRKKFLLKKKFAKKIFCHKRIFRQKKKCLAKKISVKNKRTSKLVW